MLRIRDHLALAKRLVDAVEPSPDEVTEAAAALLRYFGQALPLHILDEDVTLREALMVMGRPLADEAVRAITTMTAEHSVIEPMIDEAMKQWRPLIGPAAPSAPASARADAGHAATFDAARSSPFCRGKADLSADSQGADRGRTGGAGEADARAKAGGLAG
jgi:uncharacterized phage-associated protein